MAAMPTGLSKAANPKTQQQVKVASFLPSLLILHTSVLVRRRTCGRGWCLRRAPARASELAHYAPRLDEHLQNWPSRQKVDHRARLREIHHWAIFQEFCAKLDFFRQRIMVRLLRIIKGDPLCSLLHSTCVSI